MYPIVNRPSKQRATSIFPIGENSFQKCSGRDWTKNARNKIMGNKRAHACSKKNRQKETRWNVEERGNKEVGKRATLWTLTCSLAASEHETNFISLLPSIITRARFNFYLAPFPDYFVVCLPFVNIFFSFEFLLGTEYIYKFRSQGDEMKVWRPWD